MKSRIAVGGFLAVALLVGGAMAEENLKSGPQEGKKLPGPFNVQNVTGPFAGKSLCLV
jgi:hypothetical protein